MSDGQPADEFINDRSRAKVYGAITDAVLMHWLAGTENEELREWWATQDAFDTAYDLAAHVVQGLEERGYRIVKEKP